MASAWRRAAGVACLFLLWGLAFQGSRGIWEPDEGFYSNVGLAMARSGDWIVPRLNDVPFLDKPPMHYWAMAAGLRALGENEWGARLGLALWFVLTAGLVGATAARLWNDPRLRLRGAAIYAVSLLPFLAANVLSTDTPLAFWAALAAYAYVRSREPGASWGFMLLCGAAVGCGILTKGPAALMLAAPLGIDSLFGRRTRPWLPDVAAAGLAAAIGASWYVAIAGRLPGALDYVLDNQVTGRLMNSTYGRNPGVLGALIYVPVLLLGGLPWSVLWPAWLRELWRRRGTLWSALRADPAWRLVALWLGLPLGVLLVAQSRLPLYALPLLAPLAVAAARLAPGAWFEIGGESAARRRLAYLAAWCALLLGLKAYAAYVPQRPDSRAFAEALVRYEPDHSTPLLMLEMKRHGLKMYGWDDLRAVSVRGSAYKFFAEVPLLGDVLPTVRGGRAIVLVGEENLVKARRIVAGTAWTCSEHPGRFDYFFFDCRGPVSPAP